ncbi:uncharacterized protein LOC133178283 [Saccostrea echinata]|uniref:uncharacterized protein LOC133178283 n=1 Tax=Saccostrea echinata TaxID=191078 RepID=UPI002A81D45A|nr:uncharacterized protein LOC133178283 [Saccostrea echinata]
MQELEDIVGKATIKSFSWEEIQKNCQNLGIVCEGHNIGSVHDGSYSSRSPWFIRRLKEKLISKTFEKVGEEFTNEVLVGILKHFQKRLEVQTLGKSNIFKDITVKGIGTHVMSAFVLGQVVELLNPLQAMILADETYGKETVVPSVNINSVEWRNKIGKEIYDNIQAKNVEIIDEVVYKMKLICDKTETDLMRLSKQLATASRKIPIRDQMKLIDEWMLREFRIENIERCPSVLHFIAGRKKDSIVMKVFLQNSEAQSEIFCRDHVVNVPDNAIFEFIDVTLKSDTKTSFKTIMQREEKGFRMRSETKKRMKDILKNKKDELFAKHSNLVSISMSPVNYSGDDVIHKECIVLYCLDADLIPFGEEPLPKSLEEFECNILEDFIQFGRCENCKALDHGCSVGRYGELSSGSLGFFAKKRSHSSHNGFLTAAHVALTDDVIASLNERKLSDYSFQNEIYQIVHPSFEDSASNNITGQVEDSFFGNYNCVGIDAAFIKTDALIHKNEMYYSSFSFDIDSDEEYDVTKKGRTTGETKGILKDCTFLIRRPFPDRAGVYLTLDNCYTVYDSNSQIFFLPGDSGATAYVINKTDNTRQPLGLAFGKMTNFPITFVCPIDKIADVLNLSILQPAEPMEIP